MVAYCQIVLTNLTEVVLWIKKQKNLTGGFCSECSTGHHYEGIAITIRASVSTKPVVGFAADYDGVLLVESVEGLNETTCGGPNEEAD